MTTSVVDRSVPPPPGALRPFQFPPIERFELASGLPVVFSKTDGLPVVTFSLLLPAGALREDWRHAGLATLTGSLLESGTRRSDAAEIARKLETLGVRVNVGTSWEVSHVDFTVVPERAEAAAQIVSELVTESTFPEDEVERIRNEQLAAILQRRAEPRGLANEMAARFIFASDSPFSRPLAGTVSTVSALGRGDAADFHKRAFTPQSSTLVVAGNVPLDAARKSAGSAFGAWTGGDPVQAKGGVAPRQDGVHLVLVERPGAVQSEIRIGHVGVPRNVPDYFPILVMNTILGGAFSSRLNMNLREKHGFTYGVRSSFVMRRMPGPFIVSTAVQTEVTGSAVSEILGELRRMRDTPVAAAELTDARQYVAGTFPLRLQTTDGVASRLAELVIYGLPDSYLDEFAERVLAVDEAEVLEAAQRRLHPDGVTILVVGDPAKVRPQLDALDLGPVEVVAASVNE
ncbi:MAG: pitrilysin family protein [Gemmatimonadota bacterium]